MHIPFRFIEFSMEHLVRFDNIVCLIGNRNYTQIWLRNGRCIVASKTLDVLEKVLPVSFVRIHKSHVVNQAYIKNFHKCAQCGRVSLQDGRTLQVARRRLKDVEKQLYYLHHLA